MDDNSHGIVSTPLGLIMITAEGDAITEIKVIGEQEAKDYYPSPLVRNAMDQLREYFEGARKVFHLKTAPRGTSFQRRVFNALAEIPYGLTRTYGDIASSIGSPMGARAVGRACAANPILIVIPCHRVLGRTGLGGFSAPGGLEAKMLLLNLEKPGAGAKTHGD
ncbi:MAG: methylated-DNA--[protein]-cysteine S-methyltransferase [Thermanaerothrix sp.]|nr:methylated-DNA--[protein]-cysteine S-methyltransferase [Thermanaerothrix sp.]